MRVLVTGGGGQLGHDVKPLAAQLGIEHKSVDVAGL